MIEFEQNQGSGAFRSSRITRGALCYIDSCEYQPIFPHGRPNHEELISKTSPKPNFRVWDSSLIYIYIYTSVHPCISMHGEM